MSQNRNVICLVVDRLHSGFIGAYGNTWISTPEIDRLAAESFLFDRAIIDSPQLENLYRSYWQGLHAMAGPAADQDSLGGANLPQRLHDAGYFTGLLTDDPAVGRHRLAESFHERDDLEFSTTEEVARSIEDTRLVQFFASSAQRLGEMRPPFCLWLHAGSLGTTWDAPLEFRNRYVDEDDPTPPEAATVPCRRLSRDFDPDELLGIMHAYAGQVSLLDLGIGLLVEALAASPFANDTLLVVLSARGFPLGEHGQVGPCDEALYSELTQIPWLLRLPDGTGQSERTQALVQPADLHATLADWCGLPQLESRHFAAGRSLLPLVTGASETLRDRACIVAAPREQAIITPAWYLRIGRGEGEAGQETEDNGHEAGEVRRELFVKPDDRFEVNEVANRCPDCVTELQEAFAQFEQSCQSAESTSPPPLTETLLNGFV